MTSSVEAAPPVQQGTTGIADSEAQSEGADSAAVSSRGQSPAPPPLTTPPPTIPHPTTPLKSEPNNITSEPVKDEPNPSQSTVSVTPPPEGVTRSDSGPAAPPAPGGQLSSVLSRLKKRVVDTTWQGVESKVSKSLVS